MDAAVRLLVGTRKGAWMLRSDSARSHWTLDGPLRLGETVNHMVLDPRDRKTMLMAVRTGHLGPTVLRSSDAGETWTEAARPPALPKVTGTERARAVNHVFWLAAGSVS